MMEDRMRRNVGSIILGVLLVAGGVLFLLANFGVAFHVGAYIGALAFGAGGLAFAAVYLSDQERWWALFPASACLGLAGTIGLSTLAPWVPGTLVGGFFLASLSVGFWVLFLTRPLFWWAEIPGGVLFTLALVAALGESLPGELTGSLFFFGLAATFGLLFLLPLPGGRQTWAIFPAGGLLLFALFIATVSTGLLGIMWPLALIAGGVYVLWRRQRHLL